MSEAALVAQLRKELHDALNSLTPINFALRGTQSTERVRGMGQRGAEKCAAFLKEMQTILNELSRRHP